jgi:hypothetical protein
MQKPTIWNAKNAWPKNQKFQSITTVITRYLRSGFKNLLSISKKLICILIKPWTKLLRQAHVTEKRHWLRWGTL